MQRYTINQGCQEKKQVKEISDFHSTPLQDKFEFFLEARARHMSSKIVCIHGEEHT